MEKEKENSTKKRFQLGSVLTMSFAHFLHDTYSSFLAPILPMLIEKFGMNYTLAGLLTVFQRIPSLINPFVGLIADKKSVRYFVTLTPAITAIAMSLLGAAPNYIILAILLLVMGVSSAIFHVPSPVLIKKVSGKNLKRISRDSNGKIEIVSDNINFSEKCEIEDLLSPIPFLVSLKKNIRNLLPIQL